MIKSIGYAYATSPYAKRLKSAACGCYYVETRSAEVDTKAIKLFGPFEDIDQAEAMAVSIDADWSTYTRRAAT